MADVQFWIFTILYIIWWPISQILKVAIILLEPIWAVVGFILLPFIHLAQTLFSIISFPFRRKWLDRIEVRYVSFKVRSEVG